MSEIVGKTVENIRPYGMHVLVRRLPPDGVSEKIGGLYMPESMNERNLFCELLKVGPGEFRENGHVPATSRLVGSHVAIRQYDGVPISKLEKDILLVDGRKIEGMRSSQPWPDKI